MIGTWSGAIGEGRKGVRGIKAKKRIIYDIAENSSFFRNGDELGPPSAHIVIEFPELVEDLSGFRSALKKVLEEILEICK